MGEERFEARMNQSDSTMWRIERDPELRTTIVGISLLDSTPDWDRLHHRIEQVVGDIPRMRQRVEEPPLGIGPPKWVEDERFDLEYHLRHVVAPEPGDLQAVLDLAAPIAMGAFDKDRPLWETTLVEGLADGGAALIQKFHHSLTDGVGAMKLARVMFDEHADDEHPDVERTPHTTEHKGGIESVIATVGEQLSGAAQLAARTAGAVPKVVERSMLHPMSVASQVTGTAKSIVKLVRPASEPLSPVMRDRGLSRRLATIELPLEGLRAAGHAADGTLNDAFLGGLTGGLHRYHVRHGAPVERLRVTMPINLRTDDDAVGNNRFVPARFTVPIDETDPVLRMQQLGEIARGWRNEPGLKFTDVVAGALNSLPPQATAMALGGMLKAIDFVATNVPGLDRPAYLAGARVDHQFAFAPTSGSAFSAALISHVGRCSLGLLFDASAVPDADVLTDCIVESFDEILALA